MALLKKNLWSIFYLLTLLFTLYFAFVSYAQWQRIYAQAESSQENTVRLIANATQALYRTNEVMLDILGHRFLEDTAYQDNLSAMDTLNAALEGSPAIISIALVDPLGNMLFATNNLDVSRFPNLLEQPQTRDSFIEVMNSDSMLFGRTYFFEPFQDWIVPIRKAVRHPDGSVYRVITAALRLDDSFGHIIKHIDQDNRYISLIVREDMHVQYASNSGDNGYQIYQTELSSRKQDAIRTAIAQTHGDILDNLWHANTPISFVYASDNSQRLVSLQYNPDYKLWFLLMTEMELLWKDFTKLLVTYFLIFLFVLGTLYFLFRTIATAEAKRNADLLYQATHDQLTGLLNRSYLQNHVQQWINPEAGPFSLLYIDLDNFKNINDSFGHHHGDLLLQELSQRLLLTAPEDGALLRHGGDEFILLVKEHDDNALLALATKLIETASQPYLIYSMRLHVGASVGIAKYPQHGETLDDLLRAADIAMYESKRLKNRAHLFQNPMQDSYLRNLHIEQALRGALENHELYMVYQPQITGNGTFYGVEALVRWNSPVLGNVPPDAFIPVAETSGQMPRLGRYIIESVFRDIKKIQNTHQLMFYTSINLSVRQLLEADFATYFISRMQKENISGVWLTLEITESLLIEDIPSVLPLLHTLKSYGVQLSMDDFGTGYSSLSMLRMLPIDELKIDKSFMDAAVADRSAQQMVQSIVTIGKNLEMDVVAEGVETREQLEMLTHLGCDRFQGYYFARPLDTEALVQFITEQQTFFDT
ncbi:diguanylate cyclase/phosphodiesterase (GGDEF & EAL domains) with PAS/PAC sensor(s) [Nitrincola lacisaponensis]|uniref:Diguanylate cyclase/phosphodiesterase (GGDEF & EAL domains) with PAS/PAC sensor(S) n=1 Tax=Nitrincola lacisaponensis TaxID=267850 RepID=A0A063Y0C6_9GAMM|nr:EAL domain-containing protein [Nitrincola lacisaponensis]KDE39154.1 diguanylate cyclase/phosphodiesterase (GGDEF & EAL domains) with PAS/PAC sensor(s) [Nitrincola lacisaponensis]